MPRPTSPALTLLALSTLFLTSCTAPAQQEVSAPVTSVSASAVSSATPSAGQEPLRIGTGITPETRHAAHLYAQALTHKGYTVEIVETGKSRPDIFTSLGFEAKPAGTATPGPSPQVDIVPDLSGDLLLYLTDNGAISPTALEEARSASPSASPAEPSNTLASASSAGNPTATPTPSAGLNLRGLTSSDIVGYLDRSLPDSIELLAPSKATNRYGYAITAATATRHGITSMSDLNSVCPKLTFTTPSNYSDNPSGGPSLTQDYKCVPTITSTHNNRSDLAAELIQGRADLAYLYSTSTEITQHQLTFLDDPEGTQLAQNIVPLTRAGQLPDDVTATINSVSAQLDTPALNQLNALTSGPSPISETDAANFWLSTTKE